MMSSQWSGSAMLTKRVYLPAGTSTSPIFRSASVVRVVAAVGAGAPDGILLVGFLNEAALAEDLALAAFHAGRVVVDGDWRGRQGLRWPVPAGWPAAPSGATTKAAAASNAVDTKMTLHANSSFRCGKKCFALQPDDCRTGGREWGMLRPARRRVDMLEQQRP